MAEKGLNNEGYNLLARTMQNRMQTVGNTPAVLDFGVIQGDYSLLLNQYPEPFPRPDYFVCRQLTLGKTGGLLTKTKADGSHDHGPSGSHGGHSSGSGTHSHTGEGPHTHEVLVPEKMRGLMPGDHVLAAWVGSDVVVLDIILPATEVG